MLEISVIMPLYNAQKYLKESLDSILCQSFSNFELICINDGSSDDTENILKEYQSRDSRINIYKNAEKSGAALSRNKGIEVAKGKYIIFLDGDDLFEETMLEEAYKTANDNNADIVMFEYKHAPSETIGEKKTIFHGDEYKRRYCKSVFSIKDLKPYEITLWSTGPCNKLIRREFVLDNNIYFQDIPSANDVYFSNMILFLAQRVIILDTCKVMIYARDHNEPSRISNSRSYICTYKAYLYLLQQLTDRNKYKEYSAFFWNRVIIHFLGIMNNGEKTKGKEFYNFLRDEGIKRMEQIDDLNGTKRDYVIQDILNKFYIENYESEWYRKINILKFCLDQNWEKIQIFGGKIKNNKIITIWGAGKNGEVFLEKCIKENIKIDYLVDSSIQKQKTFMKGLLIQKPETVLPLTDIVIVTPGKNSEDIINEIMFINNTVEVVDLTRYLGII